MPTTPGPRSHLALCSAILLLLSLSARAAENETQASAQESVPLEVFIGPKIKRGLPPKYPGDQRRLGNEGWVQLSMMIDSSGKPYEISVSDSTGNPVLNALAVKAAAHWTFEPARLNGVPVDSSYTGKVTFTITEGDRGATNAFIEAYGRSMDAIEAADRAAADAAMTRMKATNLYEDAYLNLTRFRYFVLWGTKAEQIEALKRAIAHEGTWTYLPKKTFVDALVALMALNLEVNDFAEVLDAWGKLQNAQLDEHTAAQWRPIIADLEAMKTDGRTYRVAGALRNATSWHFKLHKNKFSIDVASGRVSEVRLRCKMKYVFFRFDPALQYTIDDRFGPCEMELVGEPGTEFLLTQS
jgi:protein TonB